MGKPRKKDHVEGRWQFYLFVRAPGGQMMEIDNGGDGGQNDSNDALARDLLALASRTEK